MQDRYAGDIGDFSKLALLRCLAKEDLRVGLLWWRTPDERNGDGGVRATAYLRDDKKMLRACDPALYDALQRLVESGSRSIASLESAAFARSWTGHGELVPDDAARIRWLDGGLERVRSADIVCLDPDNGLLPASAGRRAKPGKYILAAELQRAELEDKVLVLYQHLTRLGSADAQRVAVTERVRALLGRPVAAARWRRVSGRLYVVVLGTRHDDVVLQRLTAMRAVWRHGPDEHFTVHLPGG